MKRKKVAVLMSGGVDSSVAALLLKKKNYEIFGIHLKVSRFCNPQDELDARLVAEKLNFPIYTIDISEDYQRMITLEMLKEYALGFTPNPDVVCNSQIKFKLVLNFINNLKIDYLATGHYAKIIEFNGEKLISLPKDNNKDQTYFLWQIDRKSLKKILFPIGDYLKTEVREIAKENKLPNADKKDSQGLCFLGKIRLRDFLKEYLPVNQGVIVDSQGNFLGYHPGYYFFTEGQRHGLNISNKVGPYYVALKNVSKNILVVAKDDDKILFSNKIKLKKINLLVAKKILDKLNLEKLNVFIRCRYRQALLPATINFKKKMVYLREPIKGVALGQSAVFYLNGDEVNKSLQDKLILLGGGIIINRYYLKNDNF